jgi:chromosome segregation ATPase
VPSSGFDRLEQAIGALVEQHEQLGKTNHELEVAIAERDDRIRTLEGQLLESNQLRQDVAKRIDELIGEIDQLDAQLESVES